MISQRLSRVRAELQARDIGALVLVPGANLTYLTDLSFMLLKRPILLFLAAAEDGENLLVIPELELPVWEAAPPFPARTFPWSDAQGPAAAMQAAAASLGGARTLAAEFYRMRLVEHALLRTALPTVGIVEAEAVLTPVRIVKDATEIAAHRRAVQVTEAALAEIMADVRPGMTERAIAGRLTAALLRHGGESVPIEPHVQSGPNTALPHGATSDRRVEIGDFLLLDFVTTVAGYYADITRTFVVGAEPTAEQRRVYETVLAANAAGRAAGRAAVTGEELDAIVRRVIDAAGYGPRFIHRTGHGLGLEVHEEPQIVAGNRTPLAPGMVFTIEPGIYLPGWGGVRIEDDVVVTEDGCESLTSYNRGLLSVS